MQGQLLSSAHPKPVWQGGCDSWSDDRCVTHLGSHVSSRICGVKYPLANLTPGTSPSQLSQEARSPLCLPCPQVGSGACQRRAGQKHLPVAGARGPLVSAPASPCDEAKTTETAADLDISAQGL